MRFLTYDDLRSRKGIPYSKNHLRRMWQRGDFPIPVQLSPRCSGWAEETIDAWIKARLEKSGEAA